MDLRHLRYFIAVAEERNIGRAAARLHISQPPLTRQIQQLEEELGVQLFIRTPRGMELTQPGELFLEEARNIRAVVEQATERTQRAGQGQLSADWISAYSVRRFSARSPRSCSPFETLIQT
ncbi:TPA: LysR family transcriptional regulator [Pseudomonas aeruginosa]